MLHATFARRSDQFGPLNPREQRNVVELNELTNASGARTVSQCFVSPDGLRPCAAANKSTLSRPCLSVWRSSVQPQPSFFKAACRCRRRARARVRGWLVASRWQRGGAALAGRAMEEPQQSNDRVTAASERVAPLARPTWVQGPAGDAPGGQAGEGGAPEAAAKHAAAQLPCLDASHPRHCSMCDPAARSGVDAARQRARHAGLHTCWL